MGAAAEPGLLLLPKNEVELDISKLKLKSSSWEAAASLKHPYRSELRPERYE